MKSRSRCRPLLEQLEDRLAPAAFIVNSALDTDDGLGLNGTTTLRKAIRLSNVSSDIDNITFDDALKNQTIILGGSELSVTNPVSITGPGASLLAISGDHLSRIFHSSSSLTVIGLTLKDGQAPSQEDGGAVLNEAGGFLDLANTVITGNSAFLGGGVGSAGANSGLFFDNSTFSHNSALGFGGGVYTESPTTFLDGGSFIDNTAFGGGGIATNKAGTNFSFSGVTFSGNSATSVASSDYGGGGGAIYNIGKLQLTSCIFDDNSSAGADNSNGGGAINNLGGAVTILKSTLSNNSTDSGYGGAISSLVGDVTIFNCSLSGNSAYTGGAVSSISVIDPQVVISTTTIINSTLADNSAAQSGGGIYNEYQELTILDCTISGNQADSDQDLSGNGGGLDIRNKSGALTIANTIVAGNFTGNTANPDDIAGTVDLGRAWFNLVGDASSAGGMADHDLYSNIVGVNGVGTRDITTILDPTLANSGGLTNVLKLVEGSPALNAGSSGFALEPSGNPLTTDQRGSARYVDTVDIGAFEFPRPRIVTFTSNSGGLVTSAFVGAGGFYFTIVFDAPMDTSVAPTFSFPGANPSTTLSFNSTLSGWTDSTTYKAYYDVAASATVLYDIDVHVDGGKGTSGFTSLGLNAFNFFRIDTLDPIVTSVTPSLSTITDSNIGTGTFSIAVAFNKPMNQAVTPTISFPQENPSSTLTLNYGLSKWLDSQTFSAVFDVSDQNVKLPKVDVRVTGAQDSQNHFSVSTTFADQFDVMTKSPVALSVVPSVSTIKATDVGVGGFILTVTYDSSMDTSLAPTFSFPVEDPSQSLTTNAALSGWTNDTTYNAYFDVANSDTVLPGIDVRVTGAKDTSGIASGTLNAVDLFGIKTGDSPTVISLTTNLRSITDHNVGAGKFTITISFSEAMNQAVAPAISFPTENPGTTLTRDNALSKWLDATTYIAVFATADVNIILPNVDVRVSGARDLHHNSMVVATFADQFNIDTRSPVVLSVVPSTINVNDARVGAGTFALTVTFSSAMNHNLRPVVSFPSEQPGASLMLNTTLSAWINANTYKAVYNVKDTNTQVTNVDVRLSGAQSLQAVSQVQEDFPNVFSVALDNPIVLSAVPNSSIITDANTGLNRFTLTLSVSEPVATAFVPLITFPTLGENPLGTLVRKSGSWTDNRTYTAVYDVVDLNRAFPAVNVLVSGIQNSAGNKQPAKLFANVFSVHMINPKVVGITPAPAKITNVNIGAGKFAITIAFDRLMDTSVLPTLSFPVEDPSSTLTFASGIWISSTQFRVTFNVQNAHVSLAKIDVGLTGAKDAWGNSLVPAVFRDLFAIATV